MIRLLVTSGRGPAECRIAVAKTLEVMRREAEALELDVDLAPGADPDGHGPASAIAVISGLEAERFARRWVGSLQWLAQSPLRPHHKRKNWFIGVVRLTTEPVANAALDVKDVRFEAMRAGGPGGQHQNKTESAVRAVHVPSGLSTVARDGRSQHRNKAIALARLGELMRLAQNLAQIAERQHLQAGHDQLERGRPVRRFKGETFHDC